MVKFLGKSIHKYFYELEIKNQKTNKQQRKLDAILVFRWSFESYAFSCVFKQNLFIVFAHIY